MKPLSRVSSASSKPRGSVLICRAMFAASPSSSACGRRCRTFPSAKRTNYLIVALDAEDGHFRRRVLRRPENSRQAGGGGNELLSFGLVGYDAAADGAANLLPPQFVAGVSVENIEIAAHVAEEHDATRRRRDAALHRIVGPNAPAPCTGLGVNGIDPTRPIRYRIWLAPEVIGVQRIHAGPRCAVRDLLHHL